MKNRFIWVCDVYRESDTVKGHLFGPYTAEEMLEAFIKLNELNELSRNSAGKLMYNCINMLILESGTIEEAWDRITKKKHEHRPFPISPFLG